MRSLLLLLPHALLVLLLSYPNLCFAQSYPFLSDDEFPSGQPRKVRFLTAVGKDELPADPSKDAVQEPEYRPARAIKHFTEPRILLKGTAEEIGLDSRTLSSALGIRFLQELPFLQSDFAFDKTYETWEIGLFECEAWTVGSKYPIAFHVQCSGGSMDEPGHWRYATLGYGPKDKIVEIVKNTLDSIIAEYAAFVRKAHGRTES